MQEEQVPAGCAGAPGVKVNLKPGPSQLRKQKQRPAQADEYSSAQKSNPSAPASTQKPASSWDHQARGPNLKGRLGWGSPGASFLSFPAPRGPGCTLRPSPKPPPPILSSKEVQTPLQLRPPPGCCQGTTEKGLRARCSQSGLGIPASFELPELKPASC